MRVQRRLLNAEIFFVGSGQTPETVFKGGNLAQFFFPLEWLYVLMVHRVQHERSLSPSVGFAQSTFGR